MSSQVKIAALVETVRLIPLLFHRMRAVGDALHEEHDITTSMRGVMQSLSDGGAQTVPQMAAARPVSRQHIQTIVNALAARNLVRATPNPAHKRSPLIELTKSGRDLFPKMRKAESDVLQGLLSDFTADDLQTVQRVLMTLATQMETLSHTIKEKADDT